jgi:hypothetical protein
MPMFPSNVVYKIASYLQTEDLATIASLSRVCRIVHQVTLPLLYDTLVLDDTEVNAAQVSYLDSIVIRV